MDDSFELEYADELDAIGFDDDDALEPPKFEKPISKRSLKFSQQSQPESDLHGKSQISTKSFEEDISDFISNGLSSPGARLTDYNDNRKRLQSSPGFEDDEIDGFNPDENNPASSKRQRITEEPVQSSTNAAIDFIRQTRKNKSNQSKQDGTTLQTNMKDDLERRRVFRRVPKTDFLSSRSGEGQTFYMQVWDEDVFEAEIASLNKGGNSINLLPTHVSILKEQIEAENSKRIMDEADRLRNVVDRLDEPGDDIQTLDEVDAIEDRETSAETGDTMMDTLTEGLRSLWVEKYAPRKYTELLSEESLNRSLLHWLKLWDYVVFGKDIPKPMKKGLNNKFQKKEMDFKFKKKLSEVAEDLDKNFRPEQKISLLCGPPGLGKTTAAHIVATHAGYNVVEMNASDDRSVEVFRNKLESATQMKSVMEADPRPNCLIIDEIDGAPAPAINVLLNLIRKSDTDAVANKKKKKDGGLLLRPIICVCNDQYVPALRQLRQNALILNFPQTESSKLARRLHQVVKCEKLKADVNALLALCEKTDNDIRSCLNTLQFVQQKQKELTMRDVHTMSVGQKDSQKSLFSVWSDIFTMPRPKTNRFVSLQNLAEGNQDTVQRNNISNSARFDHITYMCQAAGEADRVMQGIYENYLESKAKDPNLVGLNIANDWLCFTDCMNQYLARSQDYSVMKFSSYLPVIFHFLYATYSPPRIQFPHSQTEARLKHQKTLNLLNSMLSDMSPMTQTFTNANSLTLDLLAPLLDILQPTLRPVNTQLYSNREKEDLMNVVNIMIAYNMTYQQEKTPEGQYVYALDPNVEEVIKFPGLKQRKQLTYGAKQMIAREIVLEKMRQAENSRKKHSTPATQPMDVDKKKKSAPAVPNHLQKLEAKSIAPERAPTNFFGNFVRSKREKAPSKTSPESEQKEKHDKSKRELLDTVIWFHFKEGFSNAVRRTVKVQDLL